MQEITDKHTSTPTRNKQTKSSVLRYSLNSTVCSWRSANEMKAQVGAVPCQAPLLHCWDGEPDMVKPE